MGMGHVSAGEIRQERQGDDVPGREHRGARTYVGVLSRKQVGAVGEAVAAHFLIRRGASIIGRNVRVGRGEVDLLATISGTRTVVEVKTGSGADANPIYHFDTPKQRQLRTLARRLGATRVDYVGVELSSRGATVRWLPNVC